MASYKAGMIDEETAMAYASRKPVVMRAVDAHKHSMGEGKDENSGLRMAKLNPEAALLPAAAKPAPPPLASLSMAK